MVRWRPRGRFRRARRCRGRVLLVHAGALQRRHERGSRPTAGAQATLERQLVADELINRKSDAWPHRSPLDCISLRKRSVELKGNATVWDMSAECVVCKTAPLFSAGSRYLAHDQRPKFGGRGWPGGRLVFRPSAHLRNVRRSHASSSWSFVAHTSASAGVGRGSSAPARPLSPKGRAQCC